MTPEQERSLMLQECLALSGGDAEAARLAADLLSTRTTEELGQLVGGDGAALSHEGGSEHVLRGWVNEWGVTEIVSVPLSHEEQRGLNRTRMTATLSVLDAALSQMAPQREAALAIVEQGKPLL